MNISSLDVRAGACSRCDIRDRAICGAMSMEELVALRRISHTRKFDAGSTILVAEEPATFFANVVSGVVKLNQVSSDGRQQIVGLLFPSDFLGRAFVRSNPYFAQAATDVVACVYRYDSFEKLLRDHPALEHRLFERTLNDLDAARDWMFVLGRKKAREKVASFLHLIASRYAASDAGCKEHPSETNHARFTLPLSRSDIADFLGLTIETVSRQLTHLKNDGVIHLLSTHDILVPDLRRLEGGSQGKHQAVA